MQDLPAHGQLTGRALCYPRLEIRQLSKCLRGALDGHKNMIVKGRSHDVATDAGLRQRLCHRGSEPNRLQIRMNGQRDPRCPEKHRQILAKRGRLIDDDGQPFTLVKRRQGREPGDVPVWLDGRKDIGAFIQLWPHRRQQLCKIRNRFEPVFPKRIPTGCVR